MVKTILEHGAYIKRSYLIKALREDRLPIARCLVTWIAQEEKKQLETMRPGILMGLMAIKRCVPKPPRDICQIIAQNILLLLVEEHMQRITPLLSDDHYKMPITIYESERDSYGRFLINKFLTGSTEWQSLKNDVKDNIQRILFRNRDGNNVQETTSNTLLNIESKE